MRKNIWGETKIRTPHISLSGRSSSGLECIKKVSDFSTKQKGCAFVVCVDLRA